LGRLDLDGLIHSFPTHTHAYTEIMEGGGVGNGWGFKVQIQQTKSSNKQTNQQTIEQTFKGAW